MDDYTEIVFLPKLLKQLERLAPHVKVLVITTNWQKAPKSLDEDEADLIIGHCPEYSSWHQRLTLYQENFVCVANAERFPKNQLLTLEDYIQAKHLLVSLREDMVGIVDNILSKHQLTRTVAVSVPNFLIVPFVLMETNLIATVPIQIAQTIIQSGKIYSLPLPFEVFGFSVDLLWHVRNECEPGHQWLRQLIVQMCPLF